MLLFHDLTRGREGRRVNAVIAQGFKADGVPGGRLFSPRGAVLDPCRQHDSENRVSHRLRGGGDTGGRRGHLLPAQPEEKLL